MLQLRDKHSTVPENHSTVAVVVVLVCFIFGLFVFLGGYKIFKK